jgi:serine O-acetyltransferase
VTGAPPGGSGGDSQRALGAISDALVSARDQFLERRQRSSGRHELPSRPALREIVTGLRAALFPDHSGTSDLSDSGVSAFVRYTLGIALRGLEEQVRCALWFVCEHGQSDCGQCAAKARVVTDAFARRLPEIRALLGGDVDAAYVGDPALTNLDEVLLCYPGFTAIVHHRLAHELHLLGVPLVPRIIAALAHAETGVDIHPAAAIGGRFFIDHGTGVVVGETTIIGERVRIYQGVTLGAKSFELDEQGHLRKGVPRHPIVEDDVVIYAGATILGRVTIGRGSVIGGNLWLTRSVPAGSRLSQVQAGHEGFVGGSGI